MLVRSHFELLQEQALYLAINTTAGSFPMVIVVLNQGKRSSGSFTKQQQCAESTDKFRCADAGDAQSPAVMMAVVD